MGAKIVYALSKELIALHFLPSAIIFSGALPPNVPPQNPLYDKPDSYLIEDLKRLSGTPSELLDNKEFMRNISLIFTRQAAGLLKEILPYVSMTVLITTLRLRRMMKIMLMK